MLFVLNMFMDEIIICDIKLVKFFFAIIFIKKDILLKILDIRAFQVYNKSLHKLLKRYFYDILILNVQSKETSI